MKIIDCHAYIGESLFDQGQTPDELLSKMDAAGVDQAVLIPNKPPDYHLGPANEIVVRAVRDHPDRFYGMARIDPWQKQVALEDLKRFREFFGLQGLLLHPWEELFQIANPLVDPLVDFAASEHMPVMIEAGYPLLSHPLDIAELAHRHPQATFIGTHGLQLDGAAFALTDAELAMHECPNIVMETSSMYAPDVMENIVRDLGVERLVFGSHSPWLDLRLEAERARRLRLTDDQKEMVLGNNIRRLLDL